MGEETMEEDIIEAMEKGTEASTEAKVDAILPQEMVVGEDGDMKAIIKTEAEKIITAHFHEAIPPKNGAS